MEVPRYLCVIGASHTGGILVRQDKSTKSLELGRLPVGTIVKQLEQSGDRIYYSKVDGEGPRTGWVSLHSGKGAQLLEPCDYKDQTEEVDDAEDTFRAPLQDTAASSSTRVPTSVFEGFLADAKEGLAYAKAAETTPDVSAHSSTGGAGSSRQRQQEAESSLVLPGPAALEAWFDELAKRAKAHRPFMPASNLAQNSVPQMFLVFTSMSGLLGLSRNFEYATSNAFLDSLCHFRQKQALSGREMHIGNVHGVGMGVNAPETYGVSPATYGQIFTHIISHAEHPGADIFELPAAFPQMGMNLGLSIPYLRAYDAKYAAMRALAEKKAQEAAEEVNEETRLRAMAERGSV